MLTIKQLKELIKDVDDETLVVIATEDIEWADRNFFFVEKVNFLDNHFVLSSEHELPFDTQDTSDDYDTEDDPTNEFGCD